MTAHSQFCSRPRRSAAGIGLAAGLLIGLSACAESYRAACAEAGHSSGTPAFAACMQQQLDAARENRGRHINRSRSGGR